MINEAYAGIRVVEISSGLSARIAGRVFADFGAEVLQIEQFDEEPERPEDVALRDWTRLNKRTVRPRGNMPWCDLEPLLADADLLITDLSPRRWAEAYPDPEAVVESHTGIVFLCISPAGRSGPYADYQAPHLVSLALSGYLFVSGLNEREPLRVGVDLVDMVTGVNAVGGAAMALRHAECTGQGQLVDVTGLETMLGATLKFTTAYSFTGDVPRRSPTPSASVGFLVPCRDGHVFLSTYRVTSDMLFIMLDDMRILDDRYADVVGREKYKREMYQIFCDALAERDKEEIFRAGQELGFQNAMVQTPLETPRCPQHGSRGFFQPFRFGDKTLHVPAAPSLPRQGREAAGRARVQLVDSPTWSEPRESRPTPVAQPTRRALDGLKVVELTLAWAGPFMGRMLSDHGAQVVKVESGEHPDSSRGVEQVDLSFGENGRWLDRTPSYLIANTGKYHVGLELAKPEGRQVLLDLACWADVVISNYKPGMLPKLGIDWDDLSAANPRLIVASATGFGLDGPYRDFGAWGWGLECQAGVVNATGYRDQADPFMVNPTIPDTFSAMWGMMAIFAALRERKRTGRGQRIDLAQYEAATFATAIDILRGGITGENRPRAGNRHAWKAPQGVYPCRGADAWVAVAVETDAQWQALCAVIGREDLAAEAELQNHAGRYAEHDRIDEALSRWTRRRSKRGAMKTLQEAGVPAGAVNHSKDLHLDPHIRDLDYWRAAWSTETGLRVFPGPWYRLGATPGDIRRGVSDFGEDNERVLRDLLGYDDARIRSLEECGALSSEQGGLQEPSAAGGLPVAERIERGLLLSWDDDYRRLPAQVAERNRRWRRRNGLPEARIDGRDDV